MIPASSMQLGRWEERVSATDWDSVRADLDAYGCGPTGPLLTPDEAARIAALYDDDSRFRSTINMGRHRPRPAGGIPARLVSRAGPPWRVRDPVRAAVHARPCLPRRRLMTSTACTVPEPGGGYRPCAVCLPGAYAAWKAR